MLFLAALPLIGLVSAQSSMMSMNASMPMPTARSNSSAGAAYASGLLAALTANK